MSVFRRPRVAYGDTENPVTPYQKAAQVWDERIGSARAQARSWRLAALVALLVAAILAAGMTWTAGRSRIVPWVVEVDSTGTVRTVGPATSGYEATDSQIAHRLARFVENVRSLSIDPVVVRKNWLEAYHYVTDQGADILNGYARRADPFREVGERAVTVEVTSAVRSSETSFELRWREDVSRRGSLEDTGYYTASLSYVLKPPEDEGALRANPLGIYIHHFHWSRDLVSGDSP